MQSHATDLSHTCCHAGCPLPVLTCCLSLCHAKPAKIQRPHFFRNRHENAHIFFPVWEGKKTREPQNTKLYLIFEGWFCKATGHVQHIHTYPVYHSRTHTHMHAFLCILYTQWLVAYKCWTLCLSDCWMLDSLQFLKCISELLFSFSTMITLWQYIAGTCY